MNAKLFTGNGSVAKYRQLAELLKSTPIGIEKSSARGWCYILGQAGYITKSNFDRVETWCGKAVEAGYLPVDFFKSEAGRQYMNLSVPSDNSVVDDCGRWINAAENSAEHFAVDWWENEEFYVEMVVEKVDLLTIFQPVCAEYHIPIANAKGWSSRLQRGEFARRFKEAELRGLQCVLLYCGDHDPDGIRISETLRKNIDQLKNVVWTDGKTGYDPANLDIIRFGLNYDFIIEHGFTWIDNLKTGKKKKPNDLSDPKHPNHKQKYVQDYLREFGARKCEANVLITNPKAGKQLCREAIESVLGGDAKSRFEAKHDVIRAELQEWWDRSGVGTHFDAIRELIATETSA